MTLKRVFVEFINILEKKIISEDKTMFRISVRDNCDAAPEVSAVIMLPCMAALQDQITEKDGKEVKLEIDLEGKTAVLKGPAAIRAMIAEGKMGMMSYQEPE